MCNTSTYDAVTFGPDAKQHQEPENKAAKWNAAIVPALKKSSEQVKVSRHTCWFTSQIHKR